VAGKGVLAEHVIEGGVELFRRHLPGHQRALGEVGGQQGLAHAPDGARPQHGADAFQHHRDLQPGQAGDLLQRFALEPLQLVLRHRQNAGIDGVADFVRFRKSFEDSYDKWDAAHPSKHPAHRGNNSRLHFVLRQTRESCAAADCRRECWRARALDATVHARYQSSVNVGGVA
jgi:hypothetical protein